MTGKKPNKEQQQKQDDSKQKAQFVAPKIKIDLNWIKERPMDAGIVMLQFALLAASSFLVSGLIYPMIIPNADFVKPYYTMFVTLMAGIMFYGMAKVKKGMQFGLLFYGACFSVIVLILFCYFW